MTKGCRRWPVATGRCLLAVVVENPWRRGLFQEVGATGDHRPFTAISVILQHAAILNTYCGVEAYEHEPYGGKEGGRETGAGDRRERGIESK